MTKIIGIAMIAISFLMFGCLYYINIKSRPNELDFFISMLSHYLFELKWNQSSLLETLGDFTYEKYENYITESIQLSNQNSLNDSFLNLNEHFNVFHLNTEDINVLQSFFIQTGNSGLDNEISLCEKTIDKLKNLKTEAETKFKKFGPFSIKLGIACGAWIVILLF